MKGRFVVATECNESLSLHSPVSFHNPPGFASKKIVELSGHGSLRSDQLAEALNVSRILQDARALFKSEFECVQNLVQSLPHPAARALRPGSIPDQLIGAISRTKFLKLGIDLDSVMGFLSHEQGAVLYTCAEQGPGEGEIVEIGSFMGRSTIWTALGSMAMGREKVTAIDPHLGSPEHRPGGSLAHLMPEEGTTAREFFRNLSRFGVFEHVNPLITTSEKAAKNWKKPIRFLFIDGDHSYEMVKKDFLLWEQHVVPGGLIAFHDVFSDGCGPHLVVDEYVRDSGRFHDVVYTHGLYVVQKIG